MSPSKGPRRRKDERPLGAVIARVTRSRARKMWSRLEGTVAGEDSEELHQMRVASRRVRAAFDLCAPCYEAKEYGRYRGIISEITDQLGAVRDSDVMLDFLRQERVAVPAVEQPGLDYLIEQVTAEREQRRPALVAYLEGLMADEFPDRFRRFLRDGRAS